MCDTGRGHVPAIAERVRRGAVVPHRHRQEPARAHDRALGPRRGARREADDHRRARIDRASRRGASPAGRRPTRASPSPRPARPPGGAGSTPGRRGRGVEHVDVVVAPELGRTDHAHRLHHPHDLGQLVLAVDRHHRHRDRAGGPHAVRDRQRLPPVGQLPHDGVARADAVRVEQARATRRAASASSPHVTSWVSSITATVGPELEHVALEQPGHHRVGVEARRPGSPRPGRSASAPRRTPSSVDPSIWRTLPPAR